MPDTESSACMDLRQGAGESEKVLPSHFCVLGDPRSVGLNLRIMFLGVGIYLSLYNTGIGNPRCVVLQLHCSSSFSSEASLSGLAICVQARSRHMLLLLHAATAWAGSLNL